MSTNSQTIDSRTIDASVSSQPGDRRSPATDAVRVGVYGASGTTGTELVGVLARHPHTRLAFATSRAHRGESLHTVDPAAPRVTLLDPEEVELDDVDFVFACLPHGHSAELIDQVAGRGVPVVDLSGDLRLRDAATHERIYGSPRSQELADRTVYGLTELAREEIASARVVANPGCYPTCSAVALAPLARRGVLTGDVVIDAKSGVSGAGRSAKPLTHFCAAVDDVRPYALGRAHRHVAEIEQTIAREAPAAPDAIIFNPHVVPLERGMLATIVVSAPGVTARDARAMLAEHYENEPFIDVLPEGEVARMRAVVRTNRAAVAVHDVDGADRLVLTSAIDNLLKGAAGQAVQNMNVMLGLPETMGLEDPTMLRRNEGKETSS